MQTAVVTSVFLSSATAHAIADSCTLMKTPIPAGISMSSAEVRVYENKLRQECDITLKFRQIRTQLQERFQMGLESMNEYEAMRFVRRSDFEEARAKNWPVPKIYQLLKSMRDLPAEQKKTIVWDNWQNGLTQMSAASDQILRGEKFSVQDLQRVHTGFYTLSNEDEGDESNAPNPGAFKLKNENDNYWWSFNSREESDAAQAIVSQINGHYRALGLIQYPELDYADVLRVKRDQVKMIRLDLKSELRLESERVDVIFGGDSRANEGHVDSIISFVNDMMNQAQRNQHMLRNGKLMTPAEVAYLAQKFYVGVHPFADGNGRTSRFIQELVLTTFDMPHGSSGDLMENDIIITFSDYYDRAIRVNAQLLDKVNQCMDSYRALRLKSYANIKATGTSLDYSCRAVYN